MLSCRGVVRSTDRCLAVVRKGVVGGGSLCGSVCSGGDVS